MKKFDWSAVTTEEIENCVDSLKEFDDKDAKPEIRSIRTTFNRREQEGAMMRHFITIEEDPKNK